MNEQLVINLAALCVALSPALLEPFTVDANQIAYISRNLADTGNSVSTPVPLEPRLTPTGPAGAPSATANVNVNASASSTPVSAARVWATGWVAVDATLAPTSTRSFGTAKKQLKAVYANHRVELYCGCDFDADNQLLRESCDFVPRNETRRSAGIEWEHVVPAARFGSFRECWQNGASRCARPGRQCCERSGMNPEFATMVADLHNLVPAVGTVNGRRSNYPYGATDETDEFGGCDFDIVDHVAEPPDNIHGDVARASLYMHTTYGVPFSAAELAMFDAWNAADPVDVWERTKDTLVANIQGNHNPFVTAAP